MTRRRWPRLKEVRQLLQFRRPTLHRKARRLERCATISDLRELAARRAPRAAFDYTDGAAGTEASLVRARQAFADLTFHPSVLVNVEDIDLGGKVLGEAFDLPFGIAPTGFTRLMHTEGEIAGARAAARAGIPFCLSTLATTSPEDLAAAAPSAQRWFQLYMWRERPRVLELMQRAADSGFTTLVLTVDVPVAGARLRDVRNGLTLPPALTLRTALNAVPHASWWFDLLTTPALEFASMDTWPGTVAELLDTMFDPSITLDDVKWVMEHWSGPVVVKGVQTVEDAVRVAELGIAGVVLSNHGGRQLDRSPVPLTLLPAVRESLDPSTAVLVDSGVTSGQDIAACLALGADFVLVGRAYLYGLMAGGEAGVDRAIQLLRDDLTRTLRLLGVTSHGDLSPKHVSFGPGHAP